MLPIAVIIIIIFALIFTVWGWKLIREDNRVSNEPFWTSYDAPFSALKTIDYDIPGFHVIDEYDIPGFHVIDEYRLTDDAGEVKTYPRHWRDDFLENWEAEWNREAIRIEFDRLMFLNDIRSTFAEFQLEIDKIGDEFQWQEDSTSVKQ